MSFFKRNSQEHNDVVLGTIQNRFFNSAEVLTEAEIGHHVHIVGASGYGKTVLISQIIKQKIEQKQGLLLVDLKGDRSTLEQIQEFAQASGRENDLQMFHLTDPSSLSYNLISEGTATQLRDKIMLSLNWSEEYYKSQSASFLLKLLIGLCTLREKQKLCFDLRTMLKASADPNYLVELNNQIPATEVKAKTCIEDCYAFLNEKGNYNSLQGLRSQLESLILSDFGELLVSSPTDGIDLFKAINSKKIVLIFLDTRRYGETAQTVGRFLLQDLKMTSARIDSEIPKGERKQFTVIIDEFADLAQEDFIGFLDRARSARIGIIPVHQEISDLNRISPEFAARLMGNTSTLYAFLQKRPESAELISKMAGTKTAWKETQSTSKFIWFDIPTGDKSLREVEEFNIHPNLIKSLRVGECICIKKYPYSRSYQVNIARLEEPSDFSRKREKFLYWSQLSRLANSFFRRQKARQPPKESVMLPALQKTEQSAPAPTISTPSPLEDCEIRSQGDPLVSNRRSRMSSPSPSAPRLFWPGLPDRWGRRVRGLKCF